MKQIPTLFKLLGDAGIDLKMMEMGRRIQGLSRLEMQQFENFELAYPAPLAQQAWFALLQQMENQQPVIWFLRYPLDENAKLQPAAREYMSNRLAEVSTGMHKDKADALKDNPYIFKPKTDRLALFHALVSKQEKHPPSSQYEHAMEYFSGKLGWQQWSFVGYQGIADIAVRCDEKETADLIVKALPQLPEQPLIALCHNMESVQPQEQLVNAIIGKIQQSKQQPHIVSALIRAVSASNMNNDFKIQLDEIFADDLLMNQPEFLAAISAKSWHWLHNKNLAASYLEAVANMHPEIFNQLVADLMFIPTLRKPLLHHIRSGEQSDRLSGRFNALLHLQQENN